jgi:hypothetical protein
VRERGEPARERIGLRRSVIGVVLDRMPCEFVTVGRPLTVASNKMDNQSHPPKVT